MRPPPSSADAEPDVDRYQPIPPRRRWLIVALAIATAVTIVWLMLERVGAPPLKRPVTPDAAPCTEGRTTDCVGGTARVIVVPPPAAVTVTPAASTPSR